MSVFFVIAKGQRTFELQLTYLIEKKITRPAENTLSEIVFINYSMKNKKLGIVGTGKSTYDEYVKNVIKNVDIKKLVMDSAKTNFILPVYFMIINDNMPHFSDKAILSFHNIDFVLNTLSDITNAKINTSQRLLNPVKIIVYNREAIKN